MILDLILIGIVIIFFISGFIKGLFKTLIAFLGWMVSMVIAVLLARIVANAFLGTFASSVVSQENSLYSIIYGFIPEEFKNISMETIRNILAAGGGEEELRAAIAGEGGFILGLLSNIFISAVSKEVYLASTIANVGQVVSLELAYTAYIVLVGVAMFLVIRIVVMCFSLLFRLKLAGKTHLWERLTGMVLGAARGAVYAIAVFFLIGWLASFGFAWMSWYDTQASESKLSAPITTLVGTIQEKISEREANEETDEFKSLLARVEDIVAAQINDGEGENPPETGEDPGENQNPPESSEDDLPIYAI